MNCECRELNLEAVMDSPTAALPMEMEGINVGYSGGELWTSLPYTPINLVVKMEGIRLATEHSPTVCSVVPGVLRGCYGCRTGGRFNFSCSSEHGEPFAAINCSDGTHWVARCSPKGIRSSVVLGWNFPSVDTRCRVDCLGGITEFPLQGTLMYFPLVWEGFKTIEGEEVNATYGFGGINVTFPTIKFALVGSVNSLPQASVALLACFGVLAAAFLVWLGSPALVALLTFRRARAANVEANAGPSPTDARARGRTI